jgi:hypothetical protein
MSRVETLDQDDVESGAPSLVAANLPQQDSAQNAFNKLARTSQRRWKLSSATAQAASRR